MSYLTTTRSPALLGALAGRSLGSYTRGTRSPSLLGSYGARGGSPSFLGALRRRRRGLRGLGDAASDLMLAPGFSAGQQGVAALPGYNDPLPLDNQYWNAATIPTLAANTPVSPGSLTQNPVPQSLQNLLTNMSPPTDPLSYISPQAAIAAGMDPTTVYDAWAAGLARFSTQQDALNAGIPAGVVTQLWGQSRSYVQPPAAPSWFSGTTFGIPNGVLALGGGTALLLAFAGKNGR
jgi:hypothetical protein